MANLVSGAESPSKANEYHLTFTSPGGAGTGVLAISTDGTNFTDVANTSFTGGAAVIVTIPDCTIKVTLTGDMIANWQFVK